MSPGTAFSRRRSGGRIAYLMSRFPHLPETFILREMIEIDNLGWEITVYPLIRQKQQVVHEDAARFFHRVRNANLISPKLMAVNFQRFIRAPSVYLHTLGIVLWRNLRSPGFLLRSLIIFPAAVWMAGDMEARGIARMHVHYATHPALAAWVINRFTGIPFTITVHAHDIFVDQTMLAEKLEAAEHIITISDYNRCFLARKVGEYLLEKSKTIHCGVIPAKYGRGEDACRSEVFRLLSIGSLQEYKGQKHLVEACRRLKRQGMQLRCTIIGSGHLRKKLESRIEQAGLESEVELAGPKTEVEVAEYLASADCYVQPSIIVASGKMEGIPVSLMEAMASGVPVVASRISGIPELVQADETGLLVAPGDSEALAEAIRSLALDDGLRMRLVNNAKKLINKEFNLQRNVRKLMDLFHESSNGENVSSEIGLTHIPVSSPE